MVFLIWWVASNLLRYVSSKGHQVLGTRKLRVGHASEAQSEKYSAFLLVDIPADLHQEVDGQLFIISFAKSATTGQHSPVRMVILDVGNGLTSTPG